jgi:hypothetical protein
VDGPVRLADEDGSLSARAEKALRELALPTA